jgi:mono/diheme cytochrome c family protein
VKFLAGFVAAFVVIALAALLVIFSGAYNVAATAPHTDLERLILNTAMRNAVRARAGKELRRVWSEDQVRKGFQEYDEMCVVCHAAPGKKPSYIRQGLQPEPPNLAEASKQWSDAELFWIIKNGVKMTGMPAFQPTHQDEQIWDIVGFVRRLPQTSAEDFKAMEKQFGESSEREQRLHHE